MQFEVLTGSKIQPDSDEPIGDLFNEFDSEEFDYGAEGFDGEEES